MEMRWSLRTSHLMVLGIKITDNLSWLSHVSTLTKRHRNDSTPYVKFPHSLFCGEATASQTCIVLKWLRTGRVRSRRLNCSYLTGAHLQSISDVSEVRIQRVHTHPATICSLCYHLTRQTEASTDFLFFIQPCVLWRLLSYLAVQNKVEKTWVQKKEQQEVNKILSGVKHPVSLFHKIWKCSTSESSKLKRTEHNELVYSNEGLVLRHAIFLDGAEQTSEIWLFCSSWLRDFRCAFLKIH